MLGYGDSDSVESCGQSCAETEGCKAVVFGYWDDDINNPFCELLDAPQARADNDETSWLWYDLKCFNPDCVSPPGNECDY